MPFSKRFCPNSGIRTETSHAGRRQDVLVMQVDFLDAEQYKLQKSN